MVYRSEQSASPPPRALSRSPPPRAPAKRVRLTEADRRRIEVEKLLANPDRPVAMPQPTKEKVLRAPAEIVRNVQSTASAAGSGEFHVYKHARRREAERLQIMSDRDAALKEQAEFRERQEAWDAAADAKTAKNRAKRQKRKGGKGKGADADGASGGGAAQTAPKRKLAGGADLFVPRRVEEEGESEDEEGEGAGAGVEADPSATGGTDMVPPFGAIRPSEASSSSAKPDSRSVPPPLPAAPQALQTTVVIHDDD